MITLSAGKQSKKLIILNILDILRKYSDENHRLSQRDIEDILLKKYDMTVERKAIKRNLMELIDFGFEIEYTETTRMTPDKKTGEIVENTLSIPESIGTINKDTLILSEENSEVVGKVLILK